MRETPLIWRLIYPATLILVAVSLYLVFQYAPTERTMGDVQRIFYYHVPAGMIAFLGFLLILIGSVGYLRTRDLKFDRFSLAAAEVGFLYCSINLTTGPLWAKPVWGIWWTWDARLTLTLVLWLVYVAYLMLRRYIGDDARRAALSSVFGIFGFMVSILDYLAIRWWRTQHPSPVIGGGDDAGLEPSMRITLAVCALAMLLLYTVLMHRRILVARAEAELDYLYKRVRVS
jgi:heme exporter protein C